MTVGRCGDTADIALNRTRTRVTPDSEFLTFFSAFFLSLLILSASLFAPPANAQDAKPGVVGFGDLVVTGASGTLPPPANPPLPPGVNQLDETFINPDGPSLKVFDVRNPDGPAQAQLLNAPAKYQAVARDIGQVFGLALDKSNPTNIFAASTSVHGLQIVVPDADGDGRPERIKLGQPGAQWMDSQFGLARGGGPGTVWKINGETGEITKFADILGGGVPNSGPGLGNIAYDAKRKQLFVSDLDTGLIHRLDMTGTDLGAFDHGLQGRPANGMAAAADNAVRADITSPAFDAEDSGSWGMTPPERRVWGLAVRGDRLYYAVEAGPQIWSVGINKDGGFGGDPRWELDVPADPNAYPVSDIAFTGRGHMLLAQRGGIASRYDYSQYHTPRKTRVLRFALESPDDAATPSRWVAVPEDYAIGFPGIHRNSSGGIAIGYGYKKNADGSYGLGSCEGTLWTTGDALRDNPVHGAKLAQGGPLNVHGLQGNALSLVRPQNVPPWASYYVDFDGQFDDPQASGHVGDVEIPRECKRQHADLRILKKTRPELCTAGNQCLFEVEIENVGELTYTGPLVVRDIADGGAKLISHAPPPPGWDCTEFFPGTYECIHPPVTLAPGEKRVLELTFQLPPWWDRFTYRNCAELLTPGFDKDPRRYNNRSCDYVPTVTAGHEHYKPDLQLEKYAIFGNCDFFGVCLYVVRIINVGAAPYTGVLSIHDTIAQPGSSLIDWGPQPQWTCAAGGVASSYDCTLLAPVTLLPGDFRDLTLFVQAPPLGLGFTHVRNCSYIVWQGPQDINPLNEYDCAAVSIFPLGHPDARPKLAVDKQATTKTCLPPPTAPGGGWACHYQITITNTGGAPYLDPIVVTDGTDPIGAGPGSLFEFTDNPPWNCVPGAGVGPHTCTRLPTPGGLQPGDSVQLNVREEVAAGAPVPSGLRNCAKVTHDNDGDGVDEDIEDCAVALLCTPGGGGDCPQDLALTKTVQAGPCWPGFPCGFEIQLENLGTAAQPAGLIITDVPNPDAGAFTQLFPPAAFVSCVPAGTNHTCTVVGPFAAGASGVIGFQIDVPAAYPWTTLKNCASIVPSPTNLLPFNDESCATAFIPGPDLAPHSDTECQLGAPCKLPASIDNEGQRDFNGPAGVRGTLSPALQITGITSQTPGFTCATTGNASYECKGDRLSIKAGGAVKYELTVSVPANYPHSQVSHIKNMVWPDSKVKDRNPENDQHISIITIEQPKKPPPVVHNCPAGWTKVPPSGAPSGWKILAIDGINPDGTKWGLMCMKPAPPQPPPAGKPDLAVTKTANQAASRTGGPSGFTVTITNVGNAPISGPINIQDTITPSSSRLTSSAPPPWRCRGSGGSFGCSHPPTTLQPGQSKILSLTFTVPRNASGTVRNCAEIRWGGASQTRSSIRNVQSELTTRGFNPGPADGKPGRKTTNAIRAFQAQQGLRVTGRIDPALIARLFGSPGSGDSNPANDRACAVSSIIGQPKPPPPQICTGGRSPNNYGICVCPSYKPVWTGSKCILPPPQQCTGGRVRNNKGACVCPANKPVWTGQNCIPRPVTCTGGRFPNNKGQCVCPSNLPIWTGQICIPKINICSGGRVFNLKQKKCVCPSSKPVWDNKNKKCKARTVGCTGGRNPTYADGMIKCTCPKNKPFWTGSSCTQYTSNPGFPKPSPGSEITPGPSQISCSGGRDRNNNGQCVCPANKPMWFGGKCNALKLQKPGIKLPPGIKYPGIKIQ